MILNTSEEVSRLSEEFRRLKDQLSGFSHDLDELQSKIRSGEIEKGSDARRFLTELRTWVRIAQEAEAACAEHQKEQRGYTGPYGLDLEAARSQIGCRMARLRRCCREGQIPK